jgi:hypothetical protein
MGCKSGGVEYGTLDLEDQKCIGGHFIPVVPHTLVGHTQLPLPESRNIYLVSLRAQYSATCPHSKPMGQRTLTRIQDVNLGMNEAIAPVEFPSHSLVDG